MTAASGSLLVIDDIHALDEAGQRALFQLYNAARYLGLALLLSGTAPPLQLHLREDFLETHRVSVLRPPGGG